MISPQPIINKFVYILFSLILIEGCAGENKPKIEYQDKGETTAVVQDTSLKYLSGLPVHIDSTDYLIHPIGEFVSYGSERSSSYFGSSGSGYNDFSVSVTSGNDRFNGNFHNLQFQQINSDSLKLLTQRNILINSVSFLRELFNNTGEPILVYEIRDADSNGDSKIDDHDLNSLYISSITGENLKKLNANDQEVIDWKFIPIQNRIYFRSIEDSDKNGKFDEKDKISYYYLDFDIKGLNPVEYFPV